MQTIELVKAAGYRDGQPVNDKEYKLINGTFYDARTPDKVCEILAEYQQNRRRIKMYLGDAITGRDWLEGADKIGMIGRSTGTVKIPLFIANSRSHGGPGLLDHCIVKLVDSSTGRVLYQHATYHRPKVEIREGSTIAGYTHEVYTNGEIYSRHRSQRSAQMLVSKLQ